MYRLESSGAYRVLISDQDRFAIWPVRWHLPRGWRTTSFMGSHTACVDHLRALHGLHASARGSGAPSEVAALLHSVATTQPEAPALSGPGGVVTYRQLAGWVQELAELMRGRGVEPGSLVVAAGPPSAATAAVLFAALTVGATCLLTDPPPAETDAPEPPPTETDAPGAASAETDTGGMAFAETDPHGATLADADDRGATFADADDRGATFADADDRGATFADADDRGATFADADDRGAKLGDADDRGATFGDAEAAAPTFTEMDAFGAALAGTDARGATFTDTDAPGATSAGMNGAGAALAGVNAAGVNGAEAALAGVNGAGPALAGATAGSADGERGEDGGGNQVFVVGLDGDGRWQVRSEVRPGPAITAVQRPADTGGAVAVSQTRDGRPATVAWREHHLLRIAAEEALGSLKPGDRLVQRAPAGTAAHVAELLGLLSGAEIALSHEPAEGVGTRELHLVRAAAWPSAPDRYGTGAGPETLAYPETGMSFADFDPVTRAVRALPGARLYVLDERLQPVAPSGTGELFIGGEGVADGYLDDPELSLTRFLPDPFETGGTLMFRSGARARRLAGGGIELL